MIYYVIPAKFVLTLFLFWLVLFRDWIEIGRQKPNEKPQTARVMGMLVWIADGPELKLPLKKKN